MRRPARAAALALSALLLASCATLPPPAPLAAAGAQAPAPGPAPPPAAPALPEREPLVQVGLAWDLDSLTLAPTGDAEWQGARRFRVVAGESFAVRRVPGGFEATGSSARRAETDCLSAADTAWLSPARAADFIRWNGKTWRGECKLFLSPRGKLTLALRVPLESYLLGVVPLEIGGLGPEILEAGRAQAIAARSYTLFYMGRRGSEGFDLYGTVEDQVYGPVESERALATRCVETTRGQVGLSEGTPIRANYSSTCGGITADLREAWPHPPRPYLRSSLDRDGESQPDFCRDSPHYRWKEEWPVAELIENVRRFGPQFGLTLPPRWPGALLDVRVASRSRSGRVRELVISGTAGDVRVPNYVLRQVLRRPGNPSAILRGNLFKIGVRRDVTTDRPVNVVATGAGNGHGVGLCQSGALGMARAGRTAEQIVAHYYQGVEVRKLYH